MINRKEDPKKIWKKIWPVLNKRYTRTATFLDYRTPFQLLISVILSAQTTDDGVNKVTPRLWEKYPKPEDLMRASNSDISKIIRTVGYYNAKTRYIKETAKQIVQRYSSTVPSDEKELQTLPGVGRKTAVAVISNAFNKNIGIPGLSADLGYLNQKIQIVLNKNYSKLFQNKIGDVPDMR
jgi:endonuclease-3